VDLALFKRLEVFTRLSADDKAALDAIATKTRLVPARRDLIGEGDRPTHVHLVIRGWAARTKMLPDGRRSQVSVFIPGDFCDLNFYILRALDHSISAITPLKVAQLEPDQLLEVMSKRPRVTQALLWHELVGAAVQREWTHNLGARPAYERIAHLLIELFLRMRSVELTYGDSCDFPLTQYDLAEATGLTPVHVNRTLRSLRADGLVELERRRLVIPDLQRLIDVALFNANYLHLEHEGAHLDAND